jgi:hypothetical protein
MRKTLLLAGAVAIACAPAFAETLSTPSELAQTRALNQGAETGTYVLAQTLNGQTNPTEPTGIPDPPFGRPAKPNAFGPNGDSMPPAWHQKRPVNSEDTIALQTVDPDRLNGDEVQTPDGMQVGRVRDVKLGADGAPMMVAIELNDGRDVQVAQESLRYNPSDNVLLSDIDVKEMISASDEAAAHQGSGDRHADGPGDKPMSGVGIKPENAAPTGQP